MTDCAVSYYDCLTGEMKGGQCVSGSFPSVPGKTEIRMKIWFDLGYLQFYVNNQYVVSELILTSLICRAK